MTSPATTTGPPGEGARPVYRLAYEPDGTAVTARENLSDVLGREILGPGDGPDEVLDVVPDAKYLVGLLAPVRLTRSREVPRAADADEESPDVGDDLDASADRGVPVAAVDDTTVDADEDAAQDSPTKRGLMMPASMGLRFQVPNDLDAVTVQASWGSYEPESTEELTSSGRMRRRFRRTNVEIPVRLSLTDLQPGETATLPLRDDVVLRVDVHDDPAGGRRLVEAALCNDRETPRLIPVNAWLYQTALSVEAGGADVLLPVCDDLLDPFDEPDDELRRLRLQYRDRLEFAVGRTCSVDWDVAPGARRATRVFTTWLPTVETPLTEAVEIPDALLDMKALAEADAATVTAGLSPIIERYAEWLATQRQVAERLPGHLRAEALDAVHDAETVSRQLAAGLEFLASDEEALRCFRFMNEVMAQQRIASQVSALRAQQPSLSLDEARATVQGEGPRAHSWRTFQIAFILLQLEAMCRPDLPRRSGDIAKVELLFFPTGGGKTEAYLGLAAYAFAIRRRQGMVESADGPLDGGGGVTVLMRYTLRLLTAQQFQRATTLVCAAELARRDDPLTWGSEPFRIGLWVGTDVSPKRVDEADEQLRRASEGRGYRLTVLQIQRCPWCGTPIDARSVKVDMVSRRVHVHCGDDLGECPFALGGAVADGLPVLTVDEEIYRLAPAFVIATVDKFARLAREGEAASLFGYVYLRCDRHGYVHADSRHCDLPEGARHHAREGHTAAVVRRTPRLRPPDLVIQDELHLITGALGTTVGLFEMAIDAMTTWRTAQGSTVKPVIVASTATVRNAADQIRGLYGRRASIFPPRVVDVADTFFSTEVPVTRQTPGRRYVGVSPTGVRLTRAEIRLAEVLLASGQLLLDRSGAAADPYLTLVGYFNATRELAGMARYLQDDVRTVLAKGRPGSLIPRRFGTAYGNLHVAELTARVSGADITATLDAMTVPFDPQFDSSAGRMERMAARDRDEKPAERAANPYDVVLATSMLQVGVDVTRLGLMLVVGQPKNTAEYIQASSRVGRDRARPGLVLTLGNWARPRDLAHFEAFRHYHETFYARVEPLSVTPFSATSIERGLDGVLVSCARVLTASRADSLSPERSAGRIKSQWPFVSALVEALVARAARASDERSADAARQRLVNRLDQWFKRREVARQQNKNLVYEWASDTSKYAPLLRSAESVPGDESSSAVAPFVVANSMREVQPEINLLVSPIPERLFMIEPPTAPRWELPVGTDGDGA